MKILSSALLTGALLTALSLPHAQAFAETGAPATKKIVKKTHAKKAPPAQFELAVPDETDTGAAIDPKSALVTEYHCELGANVTIFRNDGDDQYIALQWQKIITRMTRVGTTTGANRFANQRSGLTWIGIPAKGILLDAKNGHQLANECKDAQQAAPKAIPTSVTPAATSTAAPTSTASSAASAITATPAPQSALFPPVTEATTVVPRFAPTVVHDNNSAGPAPTSLNASATNLSGAPIK